MLNYYLCNNKLIEQINKRIWDIVICGFVQSLTHKSYEMLTEKQVVVQHTVVLLVATIILKPCVTDINNTVVTS